MAAAIPSEPAMNDLRLMVRFIIESFRKCFVAAPLCAAVGETLVATWQPNWIERWAHHPRGTWRRYGVRCLSWRRTFVWATLRPGNSQFLGDAIPSTREKLDVRQSP